MSRGQIFVLKIVIPKCRIPKYQFLNVKSPKCFVFICYIPKCSVVKCSSLTVVRLFFSINLKRFFQEYENWINTNFPIDDQPIYLGLPENITSSWEIIRSKETIKKLKKINQNLEINQNFSRELWKDKFLPLLNLWKNLNIENNLINKLKMNQSNIKDPFELFIKSENEYAESLVSF